MPTQRKIFTVQNLTEKFKQAKALVLTDYQGLKVEQINALRATVKKAGGEFEVVKNTLLHLAAAENSQFPASTLQLKGPTAVLWAYSDDPAPLKALDVFIRKTALPKIKIVFWEQEPISLERFRELAELPTRPELEAKLVNILNSPALGLVNALNWNIKKLLFILKEVKKND